MKIRSKALYQYLLDANVLNDTKEAIAEAKRNYRKGYKKRWKQRKRPQKEIRITFTLRQFETIRRQASSCGLRHTPYARKVILSAACSGTEPIPEDAVFRALQLVSMAAITMAKKPTATAEIAAMLDEAEQVMLAITRNIH